MSSFTGLFTNFFSRAAYEFAQLRPFVPTYAHLLVSALLPIYTGAHASLSRPSSAAKPKRSKGKHKHRQGDTEGEGESDAEEQKMEGLRPSDAIMFPIMAGCTLGGLYLILGWLKDATVLNKILGWYFSVFGVWSVTTFIKDALSVGVSLLVPKFYNDQGRTWTANVEKGIFEPDEGSSERLSPRSSPLPGRLCEVALPSLVKRMLWTLHRVTNQKATVFAFVRPIAAVKFKLTASDLLSFFTAVSATLYFNIISKPWWLTNLLGFSFAYSSLQWMSPTTFWTATLILSALFFYDIYFVFFTPLMVTVATKLDIPIKLLFPRPPLPGADPDVASLAMLGLGDVVIPGIVIGLALRFDLHMFYLQKQTKSAVELHEHAEPVPIRGHDIAHHEHEDPKTLKASFEPATGSWGERLWSRHRSISKSQAPAGYSFPKPYFYSGIKGYVTGMIVTLGIMQVAGHAQPALLYLVPGVLGSLWTTAYNRGEIKEMWAYTEAGEEEGEGNDSNKKAKDFKKKSQDKTVEKKDKDTKKVSEKKKPTSKELFEEAARKVCGRDMSSELFYISVTLPSSKTTYTSASSGTSKTSPSSTSSTTSSSAISSLNAKRIHRPSDHSANSAPKRPGTIEEQLRRASSSALGGASSESSVSGAFGVANKSATGTGESSEFDDLTPESGEDVESVDSEEDEEEDDDGSEEEDEKKRPDAKEVGKSVREEGIAASGFGVAHGAGRPEKRLRRS